jgi:hypothetical protein
VDVANCKNEKVSTEINLKDYSTGCFKFACVQWLYGYELVAGTYRTLRPPNIMPSCSRLRSQSTPVAARQLMDKSGAGDGMAPRAPVVASR